MLISDMRRLMPLALCACAALPQTAPSTAPSGPNIGSVGNTRTGAPSATPPGSSFLSGMIALDDGSPLPSNVAIQKVCSISAQTVAYTDAKGRFTFEWGKTPGVTDASETLTRNPSGMIGILPMPQAGAGGVGSGPLDAVLNCELRASLAGYRSDVINLTNHRATDSSNIGLIVLHRTSSVEGKAVSVTALLAPANARAAFQKGQAAVRDGRNDAALKDFQRAVALYPNYADAWLALGRARMKKNDPAASRAFERALAADSKLIDPYMELGIMAGREKRWQDAARYLDRGLQLDPVDYPQAWFVDAMAHYYLGDYDSAEKSARAALKLDPHRRIPRADYVLGMALAQKHDYASAALRLKGYLESAPNAPDANQVRAQLAEIESFQSAQKR